MEVSVTVGTCRSKDVDEGLRLYGESLYGNAFDSTRLPGWSAWIFDNPFGAGVYSSARCNGRVVGFYSLIPARATFKGRAVDAAKGEFLVVAKQFRTAQDPVSGLPVPVALISAAKDAIFQRGISLCFGVSTRAGAFLSKLTGARPITSELTVVTKVFPSAAFTFLLDQPDRALRLLARILQQEVRWNGLPSGESGAPIVTEPVDTIPKNWCGEDKLFCLTAGDREWLNFRFPAADYLKFLAYHETGRAGVFVLTRPQKGMPVKLKYWSEDMDAPSAYVEMIRVCIREGRIGQSSWVAAKLPRLEAGAMMQEIRRIRARPALSTESVSITLNPGHGEAFPPVWRWTDGHTGFYQERSRTGPAS